jgi:ABC-2 type transport system permease protein
MIRRLVAITVKELLQLARDWRTVATLLAMPIVLLLIYGFALSFDVEHIRLAVVDSDRSSRSRALVDELVAGDTFELVAVLDSADEVQRRLDTGAVQAGLILPSGLASDVAADRPVDVQLLLDGADAQTASTILSYVRRAVTGEGVRWRPDAARRTTVAPLVLYNPELESSIFLVPGLLAFILMITSVIATALAVVREKERGTMESLRATPVAAFELLIGKTLPYLLVAFTSAVGSLVLAWGLFGVPVTGSLLHLAGITLLFLIGGLAWGVLISTLADTQQVAFMIGIISAMLPTLLLSGFIFPISSMPTALQWISHIVPARYFIAALRDILFKGTGPEMWWPQVAGLVVYTVIVQTIATARTLRSL